MKKGAFLALTLAIIFLSFSNTMAQFTGTYYVGAAGTRPGGGDPDYATLKAAVDALNAGTVTGNCTFYITSDLTEAANFGLGVNTAGFSITIRPSADVARTVTFTQSTDNSASSGGFIIGLSSVSSWASLVVTSNITIDGFADGGSTRQLTFATSATAHTNSTPFQIIGDVNNVTIKNCSIMVGQTTGSSSFGAISIRGGNWSSTDYLADNLIIDNCVITTNTPSGAGIFVSNTTSNGGAIPVGRPTGLEFKNNIISVKHRAVSLNYAGSSSTYNNQISVNQPASGFASFAIGGTSAGLVTTNVYNNEITQLGTGNTGGGTNGVRGIQASGGGTWNIYNNFITGFSTPASGTTELLGIRVGSASNIYFNTIVMNNVATTGSGTQPTSAIVTFTTSTDIRNNIIITEEDDFVNYGIYASSIPSTSDFNNIYRSGTANARIGFAASAAQPTLSDWQAATSRDASSKSKSVSFASAVDLHLDIPSRGDQDLAGTPITGITTDIDGDTRDIQAPYMGADEATPALPVQLASFTATTSQNSVTLRWRTISETNNYGFEVQRRAGDSGEFQSLPDGFVAGNGTTSQPHDYMFVDNNVPVGSWQYRLKQIDLDGRFTYTDPVSASVVTSVGGGTVPASFSLAQNYPNPFNPETRIAFTLPEASVVMLTVYSITGQEVAILVDETRSAGRHEVTWNGTSRFGNKVASGTYLYRIIAKGSAGTLFTDLKKMVILK